MDFVPFAIPFFLAAIFAELAWDRHKGTGYYRTNDLALYSIGTASRGSATSTAAAGPTCCSGPPTRRSSAAAPT